MSPVWSYAVPTLLRMAPTWAPRVSRRGRERAFLARATGDLGRDLAAQLSAGVRALQRRTSHVPPAEVLHTCVARLAAALARTPHVVYAETELGRLAADLQSGR